MNRGLLVEPRPKGGQITGLVQARESWRSIRVSPSSNWKIHERPTTIEVLANGPEEIRKSAPLSTRQLVIQSLAPRWLPDWTAEEAIAATRGRLALYAGGFLRAVRLRPFLNLRRGTS